MERAIPKIKFMIWSEKTYMADRLSRPMKVWMNNKTLHVCDLCDIKTVKHIYLKDRRNVS